MEHLPHSPSRPRWYVLQTKPQQEARVMAELQRHQISSFLPMLNDACTSTDRSAEGAEPLFPRYLFIQLNDVADAAGVRAVAGVTRLLKLNNELAPVQDSLILALQEWGAQGEGDRAGMWSRASGAYPVLAAMKKFAGAARGLKMIELICQPASLRFVSRPLCIAA